MPKWKVEYLIGTQYEVEIEAETPAEAQEIFERRYHEEDAELDGAEEIEVTHIVTHVGHA
ncbi:MAG: hypothetical protein EBT15_11945 [Betaproteobacteria bacterium]|nr:hypothetical protein [Betaproteobacteria bacterium]